MTEITPPRISQLSGVTVVELGEDYQTLHEQRLHNLREVLLEVGTAADPPLVVLDLSHTTYFGTAFLEILFRMWNRLRKREGGRLALCGLDENCAKIVSISQLDQLWSTFETHEAAVQTLAPGQG